MTQAPFELPTVRFGRDTTGFAKALRQRVDAHFKENGIHKKANRQMVVKSFILVGSYLGALALISTGATGSGWMFWATQITMGLALAGIGMAVMHDGNHGAYSENKTVNRWVGGVLELVGGNSEMWQIQHNVLHHTFTNIDGLDEDINPGPVLRFSPAEIPPMAPPRATKPRGTHIAYVLARVAASSPNKNARSRPPLQQQQSRGLGA